jgi:hypothetical protein
MFIVMVGVVNMSVVNESAVVMSVVAPSGDLDPKTF